jgi:cellobiose phosphorylase
MLNMWAPFNNLMTFYWSRAASMVYAGERDGLGYRDSLQDIVGAAALVTDEVSERLQLLITGQFSNGGCKPVVQPFNHHPGNEPLPLHFRSDDALWLFNAVPAFVAESGDIGFYRKVLPFADHGEASVFGHLRKALDFSIERSGAHGLPCGLDADWNDCLRLGEQGESVFVAMQLRFGLREYIRIAGLLDEPSQADWAQAALAQLDERLQAHAWDGEWFLRAYRYDGLKFGSRECTEGRIFMNPQVWAILSGHCQGASATALLDAMDRELLTDYGLMLCTPPYLSTDPQVCLARLFNPGTKENGGIFNHCQGWAVLAAAALGQGDRAFDYLKRILPASFNDSAEIRQVEPYVVCQSTHSSFSQRYGAGRLSWLSGSAVWNYVAMTSGILGIQPTEEGLRINPCIPANWSGFTATRSFRAATYHITVDNPDGAQSGIRLLSINGKPVNGNLLPIAPPGSTVEVRALL